MKVLGKMKKEIEAAALEICFFSFGFILCK